MNHLHIADTHHVGTEDMTKDKLIALGNVLADIYRAKLAWQFPLVPCAVEFYVPDDPDDLVEYQLSFWSRRNE